MFTALTTFAERTSDNDATRVALLAEEGQESV